MPKVNILKEINEEQKPLVCTQQQQENNNNNNNNSNSNAYAISISSEPSSPSSSPARKTLNHKKKRRLWYKPSPPDLAHDEQEQESLECYEFTSDIETASRSTSSVASLNFFEKLDNIASSESSIDFGQKSDSKSSTASSVHSCLSCINSLSCNIRLNSEAFIYCISKSPYHSRTWLEEELDGELEEDEARALRALEPKLEIPKWTEHEIIPCYSNEGTEDLSDDIFLKRHAKQELDEKRRKKWDVQQIREQRRIEKLRRRHCKDELIQGPVIQSFFPLPEDLETICYMDTLPLQAFGESIPKITDSGDGFTLPWLLEAENPTRPMEPPKFGTKRAQKIEKITQDPGNVYDHKEDFKIVNLEEHSLEGDQGESLKLDENITEVKDESMKIAKKDSSINSNLICTPSKIKEKELESDATALLPCTSRSWPMVMLAQHSRSCSSRTQMRKRLKYSSYLFITKRKRQQSMSAFVESTAKINTIITKNTNGNLSGTQEANNGTEIEIKILETTENNQNNNNNNSVQQTTKINTTNEEDNSCSSQKEQATIV